MGVATKVALAYPLLVQLWRAWGIVAIFNAACAVPDENGLESSNNGAVPVEEPLLVDSLGVELSTALKSEVRLNVDNGLGAPLARVQGADGTELIEFYRFGNGVLVSGVRSPQASGVSEVSRQALLLEPLNFRQVWQTYAPNIDLPSQLEQLLPSVSDLDREAASELSPRRDTGAKPRAESRSPKGDSTIVAQAAGGFCSTGYYTDTSIQPNRALGWCPTNPFYNFNVCWDRVTGDGWT